MYVLHFTYLPRINRIIESFKVSWNNHPLRTEKNWSPVRLWTSGFPDLRNRNLRHIAELREDFFQEEVIEDLKWYGMDCGAPYHQLMD